MWLRIWGVGVLAGRVMAEDFREGRENHSRDFPCLVIRIIQPATELLAEAASAARSSA